MKTPKFRYDLSYGDLPRAVFMERALARALRFGASEKWPTELVTLDHLMRLLEADVVIDVQREQSERMVLDVQHAVVSVALDRLDGSRPSVYVEVWATSRQAARLELARLKELVPAADSQVKREPIGFATALRR
ncbi:MAG TPA: hypothetical protein VJR46_01915 [Candidatus Dormibacteraeota bacterium]|nr:hypothetical protein [Candidatus Dormibacteraeota bacterium]